MSELTRQIAGLSEEKRRLLELMMARQGVEVSRAVLAPRRWNGQPAPVSPGQRRLWLIDRIEPGSPAYNMPAAFRLRGRLDTTALARAVTEIVRRHEVLRTTFGEGPEGPEQRVSPPAPVVPSRVDLAALPAPRREDEAARLLRRAARRPFDLARGPVLRALLVHLAADDHRALLEVHHVASDGWSAGVLVRELTTLYASFAAGRPSPLEPLPIQYRDFAAWQREWLAGERSEQALAWWRGQLAGAPPLLELPTDGPRTARGRRPAGTLRFALPNAAVAPLRRLAEQEGATLFSLLLAAFAALLARWSGQDDVVVGTPVAGRTRVETEPLIGFFVSSLPVRVRLAGEPSLRDLLRRVAETVLAAHSHQDLPFEALVDELAPERSLAHAPLFQVMFSLDNTPGGGTARLPGLELTPLPAQPGAAKYDLTLTVTERSGALAATLVYDRSLFAPATADRLAEHYRRLVAAAAAEPERPVADLPLVSAEEREQVTREWTGAAAPYPRDASLAALFAARAAERPGAPALAFAGGTTTYRELDAASAALAATLAGLGVGRGSRVGLCAERSVEAVVGMLAILRAGGAYVPLDPVYPAERLALMLEDAGAPLVLAQPHLADRLPEGVPTVPLSAPPPAAEAPGAAADAASSPAAGEDLAYVVFTSGSTGRPKGVAVPQRAVARLALGTDYVALGPGDRVGFASSLSFDAATFEVWGALLTGACLVEVPREVALSPPALVEHLRAAGVSHLFLTTALFNVVAREVPDGFSSLEAVLFGGEACDPGMVRRVLAAGPPARLLHVYGPTESTTFATWQEVREVAPGATTLPIGAPLANTRAWVADRRLRPVPPGVPGELVLGGDGLAWGYLGRPRLSAERFVPEPFGGRGERVYRTGDRVRWLAGGAVEFLGRFDDQVKIRGFRIEPGEVEAALAADPEVAQAAVVVRGEAADRRLVGYLVPRGSAPGAEVAARVRERLGSALPAYMVPSVLVPLEALPLTPNGKVDRRALPAPEPAGQAEHVAPRTAAEDALAGLWSELLGVERVGVHDDFFALGGHSLLVTRVVARVREVLGVELAVRTVFESPTVAGLARAVALATASPAPPLVPVDLGGELPLSFAQERLWFLDRLEPGRATYNVPQALRLEGAVSRPGLAAALTAVTARHEVLRTVFRQRAEGPVQVVRPAAPVPLPLVDLRGLPVAAREGEARRLAAAEAARPFDLAADPMLRAALVCLGAEDHLLLATLHHVAADGWSVGVLVDEVAELLAAEREGRAAELPALPVQYADFAVWQRRWLDGPVLEAEIEWWRRRLAGLPPLLELPGDRPRPAVASGRGAVVDLRLDAAAAAAVRDAARAGQATPFMVLLAAFQALLAQHSGQRDLAVGVPVAGRTRAEIEPLIGFFVNTLVVRGDLSGEPSWRDLLGRTREAALAAQQHQELPFERLVEELAPQRSLAHGPLVQVSFALQNLPGARRALGAARARSLAAPATTAKFDLTLVSVSEEEGIRLSLGYATDLFDAATARRILDRYGRLLAAAVAEPDRPLADLPLVTAAERRQLLAEWGAGPAPGPSREPVHLQVAARAAETPDAPALVAGGEVLSYRELIGRARALAARLRRLGVGPERRVAVFAGRGPDLVASQLGVLLAGGAYVPIDPDYPAERVAFQLADAAVAAVVAPPELARRLPETAVPVLPPAAAADGDAGGGEVPTAPGHLAYVIYTSGSTGRPKGVEVTHGALANLVAWHRRRFAVDAGARATLLASPAFDASVWEIWPYLAAGAAVVAVADELRAAPPALARWLAAERVTHAFLPTALGGEVLAEVPRGAALRVVLVGGEALRWRPPADAAWETVNCYGPTENAVVATSTAVAPLGAAPPPIGRPLDGVEALVLDRRGRLAPPGVPGELALGGASLARGYLGRPARTAAAFVPHPFGAPGSRLYRTGDLVRWRDGGELEFLGRTDQQVKIRGFRIEPGEVEAALREQPAVREAVVAALEGAAGARLVAYVVPADPAADPATARPGAAASLAEGLRAALAARLPPYMVPAAFVLLPELPLTPNGKVDRAALPAPEEGSVSLPPRTASEIRLAALWGELLGRAEVGAGDDFFALGGHSLLATRLVLRLHEELGVELPVRQVFEAPVLADLARAVDRAREAAPSSLVPVPRGGELPLSFAQERLWLIDRLEPNRAAYNVPMAVPLPAEADLLGLAAALTRVMARHEVLRTVYVESDGRPVQVVRPPVPVRLPAVDLAGLPADRAEAEARRVAAAEAARPFDLAADPVLRAAVVRRSASEPRVLLLTLHHIATDGWSMEVLRREVEELLEARREGRPPRLPELPVQYADYAVWQRRRLSGERLESELAWWRGHLAGLPPELDLLPDAPRREAGARRGATVEAQAPPRLAAALHAVARGRGATLFMALLAGFHALLGRWTGQRELAVGVPVAGRDRPEVQALVGFFVNTLVARADLDGEPGFAELVARTRETMLAVQAHQEMPFERLVEAMAPSRRLGRPPLVQAVFVLQTSAFAAGRDAGSGSRAAAPGGAVAGSAKFDLTLAGRETADGLSFTLEYERGLFAPATARRFLDAYLRLLAAAAAEPERPVADLPLLSPAEREQVLRRWPGRAGAVPEGAVPETSLPELFAAQAAARPGAPALVWPGAPGAAGGAMTYGELAAAAHRLARHLAARGVGLESRVAVALPRGPELVVALLAVLEAGGAYVPLDASYPPERLAHMLAHGGVEVLLTRDGRLADLAARGSTGTAVEVIDLAMDADAVAARPAEPLGLSVPPEALAYVLYTSGSTGLPKGVAVPHRAVVRLVRGADFAELGAATTFLQLAPVSFDASTLELWGPLANGGRLAVPPPGELSLVDLERWIRELGVTHLWLTAGLFHLVVDERPDALAPLSELLAGGDVLSPAHVARLRRELPDLRLTNGYGPTENTTFTACHRVGHVDGPVPIGRPIAGTTAYVVDAALRPVPPGVAGELVTGGAGLARGYLGGPAATAARFVPDPFGAESGGAPGGRLYRTGDRARWLPGGVLEFLGRLDTQVKVRGFRIEPGEVEAALVARPEVREAVVVARDDGAGATRLVAYAVPEDGARPVRPEILQAALRERLPDFMVPSAVVLLAELPLDTNGKIDRRALPEPDPGGTAVPPRDELERELLAVWEDVLGRPVPGVEDDFFALGGHSLLAVRLLHRVRERFGAELPLASLFTEGTVASQARRLRARDGAEDAAASPVVVPVRTGDGAPFVCVHAVGGNVVGYHELARRLGRPFLGLQSPPEGPPPSVEAMAERYLAELRAAGAAGPWRLGGWSMGALVAWEMARRLTAAGEEVALLALLDPPEAARADREMPGPGAAVAAFARDLAGLGLDAGGLSPEELEGVSPEEALERLAARLAGGGGQAPDLAVLRRLHRAFRGNLDAMAAYEAPPWSGRVELLVATDGTTPVEVLFGDETRGWGGRAAAARVHRLPGDHYSWLRPPAVEAWAARLVGLIHSPGAEEVPA